MREGCPCQPAAHALFGLSINECTLGSHEPDQMSSAGAAPSLGLWRGSGDARLMMEKVTHTFIFGNEHLSAPGQRGR